VFVAHLRPWRKSWTSMRPNQYRETVGESRACQDRTCIVGESSAVNRALDIPSGQRRQFSSYVSFANLPTL
jgi:hypothetical protein